jgi:hypothetical protein
MYALVVIHLLNGGFPLQTETVMLFKTERLCEEARYAALVTVKDSFAVCVRTDSADPDIERAIRQLPLPRSSHS